MSFTATANRKEVKYLLPRLFYLLINAHNLYQNKPFQCKIDEEETKNNLMHIMIVNFINTPAIVY